MEGLVEDMERVAGRCVIDRGDAVDLFLEARVHDGCRTVLNALRVVRFTAGRWTVLSSPPRRDMPNWGSGRHAVEDAFDHATT